MTSFEPAAGTAEVLLVDYGNCDAVPLSSVRRLPQDFVTLPKQSITCCLSGVKPALGEDSKWTPEALEKLRELAIVCEFMTAHVKGVSEANIVEVSLSSSACKDFSKALVDSGFATSL